MQSFITSKSVAGIKLILLATIVVGGLLMTDFAQAQVCPMIQRICQDGSNATPIQGSCEQACPEDGITTSPPPQVCTQEAKMCPDGSYVGRTGPNCAFAACPSVGAPPQVCTQEARVCPDGSTVGRTGPHCSFPACPGEGGVTTNVNNLFDTFTTPPSLPTNATSEEKIAALKKQIEQLMEMIKKLQANGTIVGSSPQPWCGFVWTRPLKLGDVGNDVLVLQKFLNAQPGIKVAESGPGSPGQESTYFGPGTMRALAKFQEMHADEILKPAGETAGSGYFGPLTQQWIKKSCGS